MENIDKEIAFYEKKRTELEAQHLGEWVLIHADAVIGFYKTFDLTANDAVQKFGSGPYLIRQIGATPMVLPTSVMYNL